MNHSRRLLRSRSFPVQTALLLTAALSLPAQTTVAVPCARDNTLYQSATGTVSNGQGNSLFVGVTSQGSVRRTLLKFDVAAAVPAGARIVAAALSIQVVQTTFISPLDVMGHRVSRDWGEGTSAALGNGGGGAPATTGDATWLHTFFSGSTWTNAGGDFAAAPSFTLVTPTFGLGTSAPSSAMLADVQSWLDNPTQNFGWCLKTAEAGSRATRRLDSRENSLGTAPVLRVTYLMPGQGTAVGTGCLVNGQPFTLGLVGAPVGGTTIQLVQSQGPANQLAANLMALTFDPVGAPLLPQCSLLLPLGGVIATLNLFPLSATGTGSTSVPLPVGFPGLMLTSQTAALDPGPNGFVLSNAVVMLLQ